MVLSEPYWDHHIPLPKLGPLHSRLVTAFVALICFINSYDGDFVFDDSEAIINNKVSASMLVICLDVYYEINSLNSDIHFKLKDMHSYMHVVFHTVTMDAD